MCYKLNAFKDIAEIEDQDRRKSFSFYVYPYGSKPVMVPQGADLISMYSGNVQNFPIHDPAAELFPAASLPTDRSPAAREWTQGEGGGTHLLN